MNKYISKFNTFLIKLKMFSHIKTVNLFFSQTGEDILLNSILKDKKDGFYIDIGAYDPVCSSNTYFFFLRGWKGINIDANPKSIEKFNSARPNDINIAIGINDVPGELKYYKYKTETTNTISKEQMEYYGPPTSVSLVKVERLDKILDNYLPKGTNIDFMSVDAEGLDLNVLKSNNWKKYRPKVIAVESRLLNNDVDNFLNHQKYKYICSTIITKIFIDTKQCNISDFY